jgi:hypothetical protein
VQEAHDALMHSKHTAPKTVEADSAPAPSHGAFGGGISSGGKAPSGALLPRRVDPAAQISIFIKKARAYTWMHGRARKCCRSAMLLTGSSLWRSRQGHSKACGVEVPWFMPWPYG